MRAGRWVTAAMLILLLGTGWGTALASGGDQGWREVSDSRLTVRYHGPSDVLAAQVLERAGTFLESTSRFLGLPWTRSYTIVIAGSKSEFIELQPTMRPAPEWAGALTYPDLGMVLIMTPGAMETGGTRYWSLLQHEMVHLILGDAEVRYGTRLPRWFQEGVATYVSGEMNLSRLIHLGWAQATGATPDFRDLEFSFPEQSSLAGAAYARSYLFIKYISRRFGEDAVARLLKESFSRGGIEKGVAGAFKVSFAQLLEGFDQYARIKATWIPVLTSTATVWGGITFLFLLTWFRKKVQAMRTMMEWEQEEQEEMLAAYLHEKEYHENKGHEENPTFH